MREHATTLPMTSRNSRRSGARTGIRSSC